MYCSRVEKPGKVNGLIGKYRSFTLAAAHVIPNEIAEGCVEGIEQVPSTVVSRMEENNARCQRENWQLSVAVRDASRSERCWPR